METTQTECINELIAALVKVQTKIEFAAKDKKNPFFKSSYADLPGVWEVCREHLGSNGLAIIQTVDGDHEHIFLTTTLAHTSGQWMKSRMPLILSKKDIQGLGSAITYGRRYSLMAMVGVCQDDEDDDGNKAVGNKTKETFQEPSYPAMSEDDVKEYFSQFDDGESIKAFMAEVGKAKKWDVSRVIYEFKQDTKAASKNYKAWKDKQKVA